MKIKEFFGWIFLILGIALLIAGWWANQYVQANNTIIGVLYSQPYIGYTAPLVICGAILLIAGVLMLFLKYEKGEIKLE